MRLFDCAGAEQALSGELAVGELQPNPRGHLGDVGIDRTGGGDVVDVAPGDRHDLIVNLAVRRGDVVGRFESVHARAARGHAERLEEAVFDEIVPALARDGLEDLARRQVHYVLVAELRAEAPARFEKARAADDLVATVIGAVPHQIAAIQSAAVAEQIAHRHLFRGVRIVQLEAGQMFRDRVIPFDLAFVHEHRQRGGGEGLRRRTDGEDRALVYRRRVAEFARAVALRQNDLVIFDYGEADARNLPILERLVDVL